MTPKQLDDNGTYLSNLIKEIVRSDEKNWRSSDSEAVVYFSQQFLEYYQNGNFNMYSASYKWILDAEDGTDEYLAYRLGLIEERLKSDPDTSNRVALEKFIKLRDYITLEAARSKRYASMEKVSNQAALNLAEFKSLSEKLEEKQKDTAGQTITVLSIFTGIAMAFFGGFSLLGSAFDNIAYGLPSAAIMGLLIGIVLFNTIFSFLYFASKISGHRISNCKSDTCDDCRNPCHKNANASGFHLLARLTQFNRKYPYIVAVNALLLVLLLAFTFFYACLPYHGFPQVPPMSTSETAR